MNSISIAQEDPDSISRPRPLVLLLLDGFGVAPDNEGNAFSLVKTPNIDNLIDDYPAVLLGSVSGKINQRYFSLGTAKIVDETNFEAQENSPSLASVLADNSIKQLKISSSERLAALINFNGVREEKLPLEEWQLISSSLKNGKQLKRELITKKIFTNLLDELDETEATVIVASVPGIDMAARTGDIEEAKKEIILVDKLVKKLVDKILEKDACLLISSSFGNAEKMLDLGMEINDNQETRNPVPLIFVSNDFKGLRAGRNDVLEGGFKSLTISGSLTDLAPTMLDIIGIEKPDFMEGESLAKNII